jgi:hypothetical protein
MALLRIEHAQLRLVHGGARNFFSRCDHYCVARQYRIAGLVHDPAIERDALGSEILGKHCGRDRQRVAATYRFAKA